MDLTHLTQYHWQPCILQFYDITKGKILQKFSDYEMQLLTGTTE